MAVIEISEAFRRQCEQERDAIAARLEALRDQLARLRALTDGVEREVDDTARLLRQMDEVLGRAPQLSIDTLHGELRGQRLREVAVEVLRRKRGIGAVVHYRDWFEMLEQDGLQVAGKDPLATFLTQISRASEVESVRPRSGLFRLVSA